MKPDTTTERAAMLVWAMVQSRNGITVTEAASVTGMDWNAAQDMLQRISRVIPLYEESPHGKTDVGIALKILYGDLLDLTNVKRTTYGALLAGFNARWELLVRAPVLALDEMDEFKQSDWAMERFQRLIDERWRAIDTRLTLLATNARLGLLPPKVASRLRDGRASTVTLAGVDFRPASEW